MAANRWPGAPDHHRLVGDLIDRAHLPIPYKDFPVTPAAVVAFFCRQVFISFFFSIFFTAYQDWQLQEQAALL